jgi:DNA topoisomerase-6 subunit B
MDWRRYDIRDFENEPVSVFVNFVSVHVPYTGAGKQAISDEEEIVEEIRLAVMDACRDMQRYLHGKVREAGREAKKKAILKYVAQLAQDLPLLAGKGKPKEIEKKLLQMIENKYSQLTLEEAEDEAANGNGAKEEKPESGNGDEEKEE